MKKVIFTIVLCILVVLSVAACGKQDSGVVVNTYNPNATPKVLTSPEPIDDVFSFIVGTWEGSDNFGTVTFNQDGTGHTEGDLAKYDFTYIISNTKLVMDMTFTYSPSNKPITYNFEKISDTEFTLSIDKGVYTFTKQ